MDVQDPSNKIPGVIVEEATRLNNIITDFLDFARPKLPHLRLCNIEDVLTKNITFLSPQIQSQGYQILLQKNGEPPPVMADPEMMYQVFLNLIINAMQAMPGGGEIQVTTESKDRSLEIAFKDKGEGVPRELLDKIWDPFFTTKETGTGLGLGIIKNIVEAHGGEIRIENRPIYGAVATVRIPIHTESDYGHDSDR